MPKCTPPALVPSNSTGFDRSLDDFQVRSFANHEQLGLLVKKGVVDLQDVLEALSATLATHQAGLDAIYWPNFTWLADENAKWVRERSRTGAV